jgi:hypothetical protein
MQRTQTSILDTEERAAVIDRAKSHLELEKQRISQLLSMLSDFSTQAALLAGCAIAGVSGESLDSMDDEEHTMGHAIGATIFVSSGGMAVATSLWVIFISSHLSSLTRDSAMKPKIIEARLILEDGVYEVRTMQWFALASLLVSCTSLVWLNATRANSCVFTALLFGASRSPVELHTTAVLTRSGCVRQCWSGRRCSRRTTSRPAFAPSAARSGPRATPTSPASPTSPGASGAPGGAPGCAVARAAAPTRGTRACEMMGSKSRRCPVIFSTRV